jgi:hypothetical protein
MRSNIILSLAAALAVFTQFAAVFMALGLSTADHPGGAMTGSVTHQKDIGGLAEVIVKGRRAI